MMLLSRPHLQMASFYHDHAAGKVAGKQSMFLLYLDAVSVIADCRGARAPEQHAHGQPCDAVNVRFMLAFPP